MKIVIFTVNALRHKFVANELAKHADETLVISEGRPEDAPSKPESEMTRIESHFAERYFTEQKYFAGNESFSARTIEIPYKDANSPEIYEVVKAFAPDMGFVFGASIIRDPLLSLIPAGRFVNMHLGLSPYYRGSGTNFWPFINKELQYVGATLLHIDAGIDTGDIVAHARPEIVAGDTVHTVGNKTIIEGTKGLIAGLERVKRGEALPRVTQWEVPSPRYYKNADFTDETVLTYRATVADVVAHYVASVPEVPRLVPPVS